MSDVVSQIGLAPDHAVAAFGLAPHGLTVERYEAAGLAPRDRSWKLAPAALLPDTPLPYLDSDELARTVGACVPVEAGTLLVRDADGIVVQMVSPDRLSLHVPGTYPDALRSAMSGMTVGRAVELPWLPGRGRTRPRIREATSWLGWTRLRLGRRLFFDSSQDDLVTAVVDNHGHLPIPSAVGTTSAAPTSSGPITAANAGQRWNLPPGWQALWLALCARLARLEPEPEVHLAAAEIDGLLVFWRSVVADDAEAAVEDARRESNRTCKRCGRRGERRGLPDRRVGFRCQDHLCRDDPPEAGEPLSDAIPDRWIHPASNED